MSAPSLIGAEDLKFLGQFADRLEREFPIDVLSDGPYFEATIRVWQPDGYSLGYFTTGDGFWSFVPDYQETPSG